PIPSTAEDTTDLHIKRSGIASARRRRRNAERIELEEDTDVQAAIADVERAKQREQEIRNKTRTRRLKDTLAEWGRLSSCHGVPHMAQARSLITLIIWTIVVTICFGLFFYLLVTTIIEFLHYDKVVSLDLRFEEFDFPSVTICNTNAYKSSKIEEVPELEALVTVYDEVVNGGFQ
ncbi:Protein F58G6.8, partial [Aphelenchoides avenae]